MGTIIVHGEKGEKMKIINIIIAIMLFVTNATLIIQDIRKWKSKKKEKEFNKWLEERR